MQINKKRYYHIDLMRFVFAVLIVYYHIIPYIMQVYTNPLYEELRTRSKNASNIVGCFFMISGVFLYRSYRTNPEASVFKYICSRVVRLWPVFATAILVETIANRNFDWQRVLIKITFLQCSGISLEVRGILWYVSSFFFVSIFLYAILKCFSERMSGFILSLITYLSVVFMINYTGGGLFGRETVLYVLNLGIISGIAFTGAGILIAIISEKTSGKTPSSPETRMLLFLFKLLIEIGSVIFMYRFFLQSMQISNKIVLIIVFSSFLLCILSENDPIGIALNRKWIGYPGRYAYAIYVMQDTSFDILRMTLWKNNQIVANTWLNLVLSVGFSVLLGTAVYYTIEKPSTNLYLRWCKKQENTLQS